jgi:hypothetical protein
MMRSSFLCGSFRFTPPLALLLPRNVSAISQPKATALPPVVNYAAGSSQIVCQLTGETDYEFNKPATSQAETRYGAAPVLLGASVMI